MTGCASSDIGALVASRESGPSMTQTGRPHLGMSKVTSSTRFIQNRGGFLSSQAINSSGTNRENTGESLVYLVGRSRLLCWFLFHKPVSSYVGRFAYFIAHSPFAATSIQRAHR